jgi:thiol-disulfide isomerase/thioredoxin
MTNPNPKQPSPADASSRTRKQVWIWLGLGAVIVLAAVAALVFSGGDSDSSSSTVPPTVPSTGDGGGDGGGGVAPAEVQPVTLTGAPLVPLPESGADPAVGVKAPGLSGYDFDGNPVVVDPSQGPVMLVFLAHWCPHCNREAPQLMAWKASGDVPDGLQVIGVTTAVSSERDHYPPSSWMRDEMKWDWPVLADSAENEAVVAFGASGFPFVVVLDTDGTVLSRWSGERGLEGIQESVDAALASAA